MCKALFSSLLAGIASVSFALPALAPASASERAVTTGFAGSCAAPNVAAGVRDAVPPEYPVIAHEMGITGTTLVRVDLGASGALARASVARSSGNALLDRAALAATRATAFRPEIRGCAPVGGSYLYAVGFDE